MKILHVEASSGWGGQEMRILREAEGMRLRGHEVIFAVMKKGLLIEKAKKAGFLVYELNFYKIAWPWTLLRLIAILLRNGIDLINTHSSLDSWIGGIAARLLRVKIVRTRHLSGAIKSGLNSRLLYGYLADFVVTTCEDAALAIAKQAKRDTCRSIATGVDPAKIVYEEAAKQQFRKDLGLKEGDLLIGTACFMRSWKGIFDFLAAADRLRHEKKIRWVIIGGGHFETYKRKADELHLDGIVHFTGHLENPYPAIGALDVFTLLSTANEGVSQAILQAAFLEKPLIATPTGGLREVCIPEKTGIQVAPFSPDQVAKAALLLYSDPDRRRALGKGARQLVEEKFIFEKTLDEMERVYSCVE